MSTKTKTIRMKAGAAEFLVEVDDQVEIPRDWPNPPQAPDGGIPPGYAPTTDLKQIQRDFAEVQDIIVECCKGLFAALEMIPKPTKVAVEFGIKLGSEVGVPFLTKAAGEANFKVVVEW